MAIKMDMSKAFDLVRWPFLRKILIKFGFSTTWVELVLKSLNTISYRLKVNGCLSDGIIPQGGVRQGGSTIPLSLNYIGRSTLNSSH